MKVSNLMYQRGDLPIRWGWWQGGGLGESRASAIDPSFAKVYSDLFYNDLGDFRGIGNDYIWNVGVANEGWEGGLTCSTAKPPANLPAAGSGVDRIARDGIRPDCAVTKIKYDDQTGYSRVKAALDAGLRIGFMHGYSDGTYDALFNMVEESMAQGKLTLEQVKALRISTEHNPIIRPDQIQKMAKYNMMPAFNGYQVQGNIKGGAFLKAYGEQYMNWIAPMKSLMDAGGHPVFNTDAHLFNDPPEATSMDWPVAWKGNIWGFIEFFVTRKMPHDNITYNRAEAMDRNSMMKAATIWGAEQLLNEKNIGSLEVGKLADYIVLDKDFFTIPEDQIHTIKALLTSVGGKAVFKDPAF